MKRIGAVFASTAIIATCIYLILTAVSIHFFPQTYSPLNNWLSDLGNPTLNPSGAIFYDAGGVLTSIILVFFFVGMYTWRSQDKKMNIFLLAAQVCGLALACAFLLTAIFPLGVNDAMHSAFSITLFISIGCFEIFSASANRKSPYLPKGLAIFGFTVAIINFILAVSFNFSDLFIAEWIVISLFIAYVLVLSTFQIRNRNKTVTGLHK